MSVRERERRARPPIAAGALAGLIAWFAGYAVTYLLVAPDVRESALNRVIEALDGEPATHELAGWVFYNAHFVETVVRDIPVVGGGSTSYVGGDGFSAVLYLAPVVALLAVGVGLARYRGAVSADSGALVGLTAVPGYLLCSIVGAFLFEVTVGGASAGPDLLSGVVLAGVVYPVLFGAAGGALGAVAGGRDRERADRA